LNKLKLLVQRLRERGISVIFVRAPVASEMARLYERYLPKAQYWDRMVATVDAPFIRADDYPELSSFIPPDGSHLCGKDPEVFTQRLLRILRDRKLM
jgi:hypothetical protein